MNESCWKGKLVTAYVAEYGNTLYEVVAEGRPCGCGEDDGLVLEIVSNDRFCVTDRDVVEYNVKRFTSVTVCLKSLMDDIRHGRARVLTDEEVKTKREQLLDNE